MTMNQTEMAAHDQTTWKLYQAANNAGARRASAEATITQYHRVVSGPHPGRVIGWNLDKLIATLAERVQIESDAAAALKAHEASYTGWARFWAVPDGHIHSSRHCSTCNNGERPTAFYLMYEVSGMDAKAAVDAKGAYICTVCFPNAPVAYTNGYELAAAAKAASRCAGSGKSPAKSDRPYARYQPCSGCGSYQSVTSTGLIRAHKAK